MTEEKKLKVAGAIEVSLEALVHPFQSTRHSVSFEQALYDLYKETSRTVTKRVDRLVRAFLPLENVLETLVNNGGIRIVDSLYSFSITQAHPSSDFNAGFEELDPGLRQIPNGALIG